MAWPTIIGPLRHDESAMACSITEQELWSGIDRNAPELVDHLEHCPSCRSRAAQIREGIDAVSESAPVPITPLPSTVGSFRILRRLGEGGMGIVYEAEQQSPKRLVAIKVVRRGQHADEYRIRLFQREAQTLARLRHPSIAAIYHAGRTDDEQDFFAMELVHGVPLNEFVRNRQTPRSERLDIFRKICDAINYAHQRGVIHRDLKPSNILVDTDGNPKILDFGLARISDPDAVITTLISDVGRMMGTLPYMSPEEARGDPDAIDVRSDVYSLGVILYELLTDQLPYTVHRAALPEAVRIICEDAPRKPSSIDRSLRGDLDTIVGKTLAKEPERRYQSAGLLADDIERFLTHQPIQARRASAVYQLRKFIVRHQLFAIFAAASVLLVSGGRFWLDSLETERRAMIERNERLLLLRPGIIEHELATVLHQELNLYDQAEPKYRGALATFRGLGETKRAGPVLIELAALLIERNLARQTPSENDYVEAEQLFGQALDMFQQNPRIWRDEQRRALEGLRTLYGPSIWDEPEFLRQTEEEIASLDRLLDSVSAGKTDSR